MSASSPLPSPSPSTPTTSVSAPASTGARTSDAASLNWQYPPAPSGGNSGNSTPQGQSNSHGRAAAVPHSPVTVALAAAASAVAVAVGPSAVTSSSPAPPQESTPNKASASPVPVAVPLAASPPPSGSTIASVTPTKQSHSRPSASQPHTSTPPDSPTRSASATLPQLPPALPPTSPPVVPPKEPILIAPPRRQSMNPPPALPVSQPSTPQLTQPPRQQPPPPVPSLPSYIVEINQALATSATLSDVPPLSPVGTTIGSEMTMAMSPPSKPLLHTHPPATSTAIASKSISAAASALPQRSNPPSTTIPTSLQPSRGPTAPAKPTAPADPVASRIWDMCDHSAAVTDGVRVMLEGRGDGAGALAVPKARLVEAVNSISKSRKRVLLYFRLGLGLGPLVDVADYTELLRGLTVLLQEYESALVAADKTRKRVTKSIMSRFSAATSSSSPKSSMSSSSSSDPFSVSPSFLLTGSYTHLKDFHLPCDISTYHVLQTLLDMIWSLYQFQLSRVDMDQFQGDEVKQHLLEALVRVDSRLQKIIGSISRDVTAVAMRLEEHDRMRKGNKP